MKKIIIFIILLALLGGGAWYYLRDTGNKGNEVSPRGSGSIDVEDLAQQLVGTWQSIDDEKSVILFNEDGSTLETYNGNEISMGTWELTQARPKGNETAIAHLTTTIKGEAYEYSVWALGGSNLVLNYQARGNTLSYQRISESKTVNWVPYVNEQYNFSVSLPETWEAQEARKPQNIRAEHEVLISEKEYGLWRASVSIRAFANSDDKSVGAWWEAWLQDEDKKEAECREKHGDESPCLFLRDLVEWQEQGELSGEESLTVGLFRFDHEEVCTYASHREYVYEICAAGDNPNDPLAAQHKATTDRIRETFAFTQ